MYTQTAQLNFKISQVTDFHSLGPTQFSVRTFQLFPYEGFQSSLITTFKHALFGRWVVSLSRKFFPLEWSLPLWRGSMEWWGMKWTARSSPASQGGTLPGWSRLAPQPLCLARAFPYPPGRPPRLCWSVEWDPFPFRIKRTFSWLSIAWTHPSRIHSACVSCLPGCFSIFTWSVSLQAQVTTVTSTEAEKFPQGDSSVLICTSKSLGHKCRRAGMEPVVGRTTSLLHRQHSLSGCCSCLLVGRWSNIPLMTYAELRKPQGPGSLEDRLSKRPNDSDEVITLAGGSLGGRGEGPARPWAWKLTALQWWLNSRQVVRDGLVKTAASQISKNVILNLKLLQFSMF